MSDESRGLKVIVRDYAGRPLHRLVWAIGNGCFYICAEDQMQMLLDGDTSAAAIGFPASDVFEYDPRFEKLGSGECFDWSALRPASGLCATAT